MNEMCVTRAAEVEYFTTAFHNLKLLPVATNNQYRDKEGGERWEALNTAIPQKHLPNTAISQNKNRQKPRQYTEYRFETRCHTETATLYIKFRANNTETEIKILKCSI